MSGAPLAFRVGSLDDGFVGTALVGAYAACGCVGDARKVFDGMAVRDVVSWGIMLDRRCNLGTFKKDPSLSQIRAETPSGGPAIRQRSSPSQQKIVALEAENKRLNEEVANHAKQLAEIKAFLQSQNGGALFSPHASPSTVGSNNPPQLQAGDRSTPSPGHARQIASPDD
ncbi:pentatricopeptide repeat-containing protein At2g37310-like isoform X2 [Sorghum bicolor]|uniref:pentatricopeptide repeat-containing protein At2g37310-like isoform X2 n=1 Tax=Sorghum bicolor TaxID=4558 RepID=UPI000B4243EE|nr:pentatricopeptide repeat-containing protein At2g37310-like isoform X2 [Sorghum bicolor]|eukprot:XP_021316597.1 pentatricopeptide repeat-containing protein At2g37310-like isoform X2 [Sorghum bicolor]